jgi:pimeloyl-ACP methyl ester carboxylesterase
MAVRLVCALVALFIGVAPVSAQESSTPEAKPLGVILVGGYGANLEEATYQFSALRSALLERSPSAVVVQYSYLGTSFDGCAASPTPYTRSDSAQDVELSKQVLRETLRALHEACDVERVVVVGHSLGGLIAFEALDRDAAFGVTDLVTVDSPLGGVPLRLVQTCIDVGFCADGAVAEYLAVRYSGSDASTIAEHAEALSRAGVRVSAWGNESDCFYNVGLCASFARAFVGGIDARETQWLGMPVIVRKDFPRGARPGPDRSQSHRGADARRFGVG